MESMAWGLGSLSSKIVFFFNMVRKVAMNDRRKKETQEPTQIREHIELYLGFVYKTFVILGERQKTRLTCASSSIVCVVRGTKESIGHFLQFGSPCHVSHYSAAAFTCFSTFSLIMFCMSRARLWLNDALSNKSVDDNKASAKTASISFNKIRL